MHYARGYFGKKDINDTTQFNVDVFNKIVAGTVIFLTQLLKLILENGIKMDGSGLIKHLKSTNNQGNGLSFREEMLEQPLQLTNQRVVFQHWYHLNAS
ncbi:MAG: hypothetical protein R2779_06175 [Crocinitomicaceae bacterium]